MAPSEEAYDFVRVLGHGGMAVVDLWRRRAFDQALVAAKRVNIADMTEAEEQVARRESQNLRRLKHPHIVTYLQSWVNRKTSHLIIVQEYYEGGDMSKLIKLRIESRDYIRAYVVSRWLVQLVHALQYCHSCCRILHRDLKPGNIFLSPNLDTAYMGDFGIARILDSSKSFCKSFVGTALYMSPEIVRMQGYGYKSDVWGLGCTIYEACALRRPFDAKDPLTAVQLIVGPEGPPPLPAEHGYPADLEEICRAMLTKDPHERPTIGQLLQRPGFLRDAALQLESDIGWQEESLVPSVEGSSQDAEDLLSPSESGSLAPSRGTSPAPPEDHREDRFESRPRPPAPISPDAEVPRPPSHPLPTSPVNRPPPPPPGAPLRWQTTAMNPPPVGSAAAKLDAGASDLPAAMRSAACVSGLSELTARKAELQALLAMVPEEEPPCPLPVPPSIACRDGLQAQADVLDARLHCLDVLQSDALDAVELSNAVRRLRELGLEGEDCSQALILHAHRLQMRAEDTISQHVASCEDVEKAAEVLEVLDAEVLRENGRGSPSREPLVSAHRQLSRAREERAQLQLRIVWGTSVRLLAVERGAAWPDVERIIATRWNRPTSSLAINRRTGSAVVSLETEALWRQVADGHEGGVLELHAQPLRPNDPQRRRRALLQLPKAKAAPKKPRSPSRK